LRRVWPTHRPTSGGCALSVSWPDQSRLAAWLRGSWAAGDHGHRCSRKTRTSARTGALGNWEAVQLSNWYADDLSQRGGAQEHHGCSLPRTRLSRSGLPEAAAERVAVTARRSESLLVSAVPSSRIFAGPAWTPDGRGTTRGGAKVGTRMRPRFG
jgi:hypothetical protein